MKVSLTRFTYAELFFSSRYIEQQSTMGSSRRFGASSELKLQRLLHKADTRVDGSQIGSPTPYDRSTRFDLDAKDDQTRRDIDRKREVSSDLIMFLIIPIIVSTGASQSLERRSETSYRCSNIARRTR